MAVDEDAVIGLGNGEARSVVLVGWAASGPALAALVDAVEEGEKLASGQGLGLTGL